MENNKSNTFRTFFKSAYLTIFKDDIGEAVRKGDFKTVKEHIDCGANVNEINSNGRAPIHHAVSLNRLNCLVLLLEHKDININLKSTDGYFQQTALHFAISQGKITAVKLLLLNGADYKTIRNQDNQTALEAIPNNQVIRNTVHETIANLNQINQAVNEAKSSLEVKDYESSIKHYSQAGNMILDNFANVEKNEAVRRHYIKKALSYFEKVIEPYQKLDKEEQANYKEIIHTIDTLKGQIGQSKKYEDLYQAESLGSKQSQFFQVKEHTAPLTIRKRKDGYAPLEEEKEKSQISQKIA